MDPGFKCNHSFICKRSRKSRGGGEFIRWLTLTLCVTDRNLQRYLDRRQAYEANGRSGVYQGGVSAFIIDYIVPRRALEDGGSRGGGVSVTGWGSAHIADINQHLHAPTDTRA